MSWKGIQIVISGSWYDLFQLDEEECDGVTVGDVLRVLNGLDYSDHEAARDACPFTHLTTMDGRKFVARGAKLPLGKYVAVGR